jgi:hypothetical protein
MLVDWSLLFSMAGCSIKSESIMGAGYKIGFARPALLRETVRVAQQYTLLKNWESTKTTILEDNSLQARTQRTANILFSEIYKRLSLLNDAQCDLVAEDDSTDVRQLVWLAICKQYPFVGDFTIEVLEPAYISGRHQVGYDDYGYFFNSKADEHPELEVVSDKTRSNARQALFQMMRQCELLSASNQLIPQMISSAVQNCSPDSDLAFVPGAIRL